MGYLEVVPGTDYAACSVFCRGEPIFTQISHIGDDPLYEFVNPADYPDLPSSVVEDANAEHRRAYRMRLALMRQFDHVYFHGVWRRTQIARKRMQIHREMTGDKNFVIPNVGGFISSEAPIGTSHAHFIADMVTDMIGFRKAGDYATSDAVRREITDASDGLVYIHKDGSVEFVDMRIEFSCD